jgi:hypothetical protein
MLYVTEQISSFVEVAACRTLQKKMAISLFNIIKVSAWIDIRLFNNCLYYIDYSDCGGGEMFMNGKNWEGGGRSIRTCYSGISWKDRKKVQKSVIRVADSRAEIRTVYLCNTS